MLEDSASNEVVLAHGEWQCVNATFRHCIRRVEHTCPNQVIVLRTASQLGYYKEPWARGYCGFRTVGQRVREPSVCVTPMIMTKRKFRALVLGARFPNA